MGDNSAKTISLQSKDHEDLLNIIDHLRSQGISRYIDLPQLIVCGDQSSGKSSVLEAVSGVRFPTQDNLCTRFATELILRRGPATSAKVTILPGNGRTDTEKAKLLEFQREISDLEGFGALLDNAKDTMGVGPGAKAFTDDVLRVEVSGPEQPHLTLVDLPGLFSAASKAQSTSDAKLVTSLVLSYMENPRSIILAVVSAKNDFANQIVTKYAREIDPKGLRTLGIITKPDTLHAGSNSEREFVQIAENKNVQFKLGWHVLKNRDFDTRKCSNQDRDRMERDFFSQGIWSTLASNIVGISSLRPRLSTLLKEQILTELPALVDAATSGIRECRDLLNKLGASRATLQEQRLHLLRVSQDFSSLAKSAVDGVYVGEFFGSALDDTGYSRRLRAVVQNICIEFANTIQRKGHARMIVDKIDTEVAEPGDPPRVQRSKYIDQVSTLMKRSRGCELPGTFNPLIIGDLFYEQSKNWSTFVEQYSDSILNAVRTTLNEILESTADEKTREGLMRYIINPGTDALQRDLGEMVSSILEPHQRGHPITYNHYFTSNIQKAKASHRKDWIARQLTSFFGILTGVGTTVNKSFQLDALLEALNKNVEADMDEYACSEAIDCMQAYYKVSSSSYPSFRSQDIVVFERNTTCKARLNVDDCTRWQ